MSYGSEPIELSVVVAAPEGGRNLARCVEELRRELSHSISEILIVSGSAATPLGVASSHPRDMRLIRSFPGTDVPKLWQSGIKAARGRIIVLMIESCIVGRDWAERILRAHLEKGPVVGGSIELDSHASLVDSAIYFCRYSRYLPPLTVRHLDDLPGLNCSYKAAAIAEFREEMADGFWETFIHKRMRERGELLRFDSSIVLSYAGTMAAGKFLRDRFSHGRYFAARRARAMARSHKIVRVLIAPAVPLIMLFRITANVWKKRRYRMRFLACVPVMITFLAAWSCGECVGYVFGLPTRKSSNKGEETQVLREANRTP